MALFACRAGPGAGASSTATCSIVTGSTTRDEEARLMATTEDQTDRAEALARRAARVIPGGVNSGQRRVPGLEGLVVTGTSGARFSDAEGRTFTDYHAAFGPPLLGHNDPDVDGAVASMARSVGLMGVGVTPVEIELAE